MANFVDSEEEILVGSCAEDISDGPELETEERGRAEVVGEEGLKKDNE